MKGHRLPPEEVHKQYPSRLCTFLMHKEQPINTFYTPNFYKWPLPYLAFCHYHIIAKNYYKQQAKKINKKRAAIFQVAPFYLYLYPL